MSTGKQTVIGAGGVGLLLVNFWTGPAKSTIDAGILNGHPTPRQVRAAHRELVKFAAALLLIAGATLIAGASEGIASAMVTAIIALWLLWAMNHYAGGK